jgi:hypothetical protein
MTSVGNWTELTLVKLNDDLSINELETVTSAETVQNTERYGNSQYQERVVNEQLHISSEHPAAVFWGRARVEMARLTATSLLNS